MLELVTREGLLVVGVCVVATIIFLVKAASVSKQKYQKSSFLLALGIAFCFAMLGILYAWKYGFFQG